MLPIQFGLPDAAGRCPINLGAFFNDERLRYATGKDCLASEWNAEKGQFRRAHADYQTANEYPQALAEQLNSRYRQRRGCGHNAGNYEGDVGVGS